MIDQVQQAAKNGQSGPGHVVASGKYEPAKPYAEHYVAHLANARISQKTLEIPLSDRQKRPDNHAQKPERHKYPAYLDRDAENIENHTRKCVNAQRLYEDAGKHGGDRSRRRWVRVRQPGMERHQSGLQAEADNK